MATATTNGGTGSSRVASPGRPSRPPPVASTSGAAGSKRGTRRRHGGGAVAGPQARVLRIFTTIGSPSGGLSASLVSAVLTAARLGGKQDVGSPVPALDAVGTLSTLLGRPPSAGRLRQTGAVAPATGRC